MVCRNRTLLFGSVDHHGTLQLNGFGRLCEESLRESVDLRNELKLDHWVVMPNHLHCIVALDPELGAANVLNYSRIRREPRSISSFAAGFKASVTSRINTLRGTPGAPVWQRGFYEHIIRSEESLNALGLYIANNPRQWRLDGLCPEAAPDCKDELDLIISADLKVPLNP